MSYCVSVGYAAVDDFDLEFQDIECPILPNEAVPHEPSQGDCTFQHTPCDWTLVDPLDPQDGFKINRTNGKYLNDAAIANPGTDHFGDPTGT